MISSFVVTVTSATLNSIAITPATPAALPKGATEQFTATGSYSDGSTQNLTSAVTWTSLAPFIATVNGSGLVTGTGVGSTQLTAGYQGQTATSASFPVTGAVVASITVTLSSSSINVGATEQSSAMATYTDNSTVDVSASVTWASSSPGVATINSNGLASAAGTGSTTISAALNGLTGNAALTVTAPAAVTLSTIAVTPSTASVAKGNTQQFTATGQYSDGSTQNLSMLVAWQSSVPSVATIDSNGLATTLAGGNTQIWASYQGVSTVVTLTVSPATLVSLVVYPGNREPG